MILFAVKRSALNTQYIKRVKFKAMSKIIHLNVKNKIRIHLQKLLALDKA